MARMTDPHDAEKNADAPRQTPDPEPSIIDTPTPDAEAQFVAETDEHSRQTRRGWKIIAIVVAVALIAAVGAYALWRGRLAPSTPSPASVSETTTAPQSGIVTTTAPQPSGPGGSVAGTIAPGGASSEASSSAGGQQGPRGSTAKPAAGGRPLGQVTTPPERSVAMIVVPKGFTIAVYSVTLKPYGWGPGGRSGGRLLARIVTSKPANASATSLKKDFAGRNVSVWCAPKVIAAIPAGGTYQGVLQVRPQGDLGVLYLVQARLVK